MSSHTFIMKKIKITISKSESGHFEDALEKHGVLSYSIDNTENESTITFSVKEINTLILIGESFSENKNRD